MRDARCEMRLIVRHHDVAIADARKLHKSPDRLETSDLPTTLSAVSPACPGNAPNSCPSLQGCRKPLVYAVLGKPTKGFEPLTPATTRLAPTAVCASRTSSSTAHAGLPPGARSSTSSHGCPSSCRAATANPPLLGSPTTPRLIPVCAQSPFGWRYQPPRIVLAASGPSAAESYRNLSSWYPFFWIAARAPPRRM